MVRSMNLFRRIFSSKPPEVKSAPPPAVVPAQAVPEPEGDDIHVVIKHTPGVPSGQKPVTALVSRRRGADGKWKNRVELFAQTDPLTVIEAHSAIFWQEFLDEGSSRAQSYKEWLLSIEKASGNRYYGAQDVQSPPNEIVLMTGLTRLTIHYAIARFSDYQLPPEIEDFFRKITKGEASPDRLVNLEHARKLEPVLASGTIDPEFLSQLRRAVSAETVA
jgi:hypothetical protein